MILDASTLLAGSFASNGARTGQAITATAISANVLDRTGGTQAPTFEDEGMTPTTYLFIQAITAANVADAAKTLTITLESDSAANLAGSPVGHWSSGPILGSAITAGAVLARIPLPSAKYNRYIGLRFTVSSTFTAFQLYGLISSTPQASNIPSTVGKHFSIDI